SNQHSAGGIDSRVHKVEQISIRFRARAQWWLRTRRGAEIANRTSLDWIIWRGINNGPGLATVEGGRDVQVPHAVKRLECIVTSGGGTEESVSGTVSVSRYHFRERSIGDSRQRRYVGVMAPTVALVS